MEELVCCAEFRASGRRPAEVNAAKRREGARSKMALTGEGAGNVCGAMHGERRWLAYSGERKCRNSCVGKK